MKFLLIFILSVLLGFRTLFPIIEYLVDYKYISEVLCINKEKPKMQCHGKCYLKKELAETTKEKSDKSEKDNNSTSNKLLNDFLFVKKLVFSLNPQNIIVASSSVFYKKTNYCFKLNNTLFKPPIR